MGKPVGKQHETWHCIKGKALAAPCLVVQAYVTLDQPGNSWINTIEHPPQHSWSSKANGKIHSSSTAVALLAETRWHVSITYMHGAN